MNCKFCTPRSTEQISVNTNVQDNVLLCLMAQGAKDVEIVLATDKGVYGIPVKYCPFCGEPLQVADAKEWIIFDSLGAPK